MNSKRNDKHGRGCISEDAAALEGLTDMGMGDMALELAKMILGRPRPRSEDVSEALRAIGVHSRSMKEWKRRVIRMADRLPKRTRYAVREDLFIFFAVNGEQERALTFLIAPSRFSTQALYLAVESLISLRRCSEAVTFADKYLKAIPGENSDAFEDEANALTCGVEGNHLGGLLCRINAPIEGALETIIVQGIIESSCALVIRHLNSRILKLRDSIKMVASDQTQLAAPGNEEALLIESEQLCEKMRAKLTRLIPRKNRFRYNLAPIANDTDGSGEDTFIKRA